MGAPDRRRAELARIHCAKKELALDEDTYRSMLEQLTGQRSAGDLDERQRARVLDHLAGLQQRPARPARPHAGTRPSNMKQAPELRRIEAFLAEAQRPWSYADGIAKHMFGVDRVQWCSGEQLRAVIAALYRDAKRHGRRTS